MGKLREIATGLHDKVHADLVAHGSDEIFGEEHDHLLRNNKVVHEITDALMNEIEKRFNHIPAGEMKKIRPGWPLTWGREWPPEKCTEFLWRLSQLSNNHAPLFWRLLAPLVNRVRVGGRFSLSWELKVDQMHHLPLELVPIDGEGLVHTPTSFSPLSAPMLSTTANRRINGQDAVLLVCNATQPIQAAPMAALHTVM